MADNDRHSKKFSLDAVAVFVFSEAIGVPFCVTGAELFMNDHVLKGIGGFALGLPFVVLGVAWPFLKQSSFANSVGKAAVDFRWWVAVALALLVYSSFPRMVRPVGLEPEMGDPKQNKYVCTHLMSPIGTGKGGLLIEFGVRQFSTNGFHTQITLSHPWVDYQVWYGSPRRTSPPNIGGHFTKAQIDKMASEGAGHEAEQVPAGIPKPGPCGPNSFRGPGGIVIRTGDPRVFDFTSPGPSIGPRMSYYIYFADDEGSPRPEKITFFEDYFAMDNPDLVKSAEPNYGPCPD